MSGRRIYALTPGGSGVALGRLYRTDRAADDPVAHRPPAQPPSDADPLRCTADAFRTVVGDLTTLAASLAERGQQESADVVTTPVQIGHDPDLRSMVDELVAGGAAPEAAVREATEHYAEILAALPDPTLATRAADVRAVGRRLVAALTGRTATVPAGPLVLVGWEITVDDLLSHGDAVVAAASVVGGATSHAGIVARSIGLPIGFGADPACSKCPTVSRR